MVNVNVPTRISLGELSMDCADECTFSLKQGIYLLKADPEGYLPYYQNIAVSGRTPIHKTVELVRMPTLQLSETLPKPLFENQPLPTDLKSMPALFAAWDASGTLLAYYNPDDQRVMLWSEGFQPISKLSNPSADFYFRWGHTGAYLVGIDGHFLYWFEVSTGKRQKVSLPFAPTTVIWQPNDHGILLSDAKGAIFQLDRSAADPTPLQRSFLLAHSFYWNDQLMYFLPTANQSVQLVYYRSDTNRDDVMATFESMVIDQVEPREERVFVHNQLDDAWYQLNY
ncbi:hypothetical protein IPJ72_06190 [Candidatus Peregrinibacteria bacterium]|nr:MAG: hypothetical protein IPJ72_06190 [Candidatus Peregrinibacteria bacterium]